MERPPTGYMMERPRTRWSREQNERQIPRTGVATSSSKIERPQSRRGVKPDTPIVGDSREAFSRPLSSAVFPGNRSSAVGSRLNTSRLGTAFPGSSQRVFERPVTSQQGIPGLRPGSTRGPRLTRLVQDKRYYESLIQIKIRELAQEMESISRKIEQQNKEKATFMHFDRRAKDLAAELLDLQFQLADYNMVLDKMTSNAEKSDIEQAANQLASVNENTLAEIEELFQQRKRAEQKLRQLQKEIETEKMKADKMVEMMDPGTRSKYENLQCDRDQLKKQTDEIQKQVDNLNEEKFKLEENIALSQAKQEAVKLHVKIMEMESKKDRLTAESKNKLNPENERDQILEKVKRDNVEISAAENRMVEVKKKLNDAEQQLEKLEKDLEENYTEKGIKYKEVHKKEQVMEEFLSTFDENKAQEMEKLNELEKMVVSRLEELSKRLSGGGYFNPGENLDAFKMKEENIMSPRNFEDMKKKYLKLQNSFLRMKAMETNFKMETAEIEEKMKKRNNELKILEEIEAMNSSGKSAQDLAEEKVGYEKEEMDSREILENEEKSYIDIKKELMKNETFAQVNSLEEKLEKLKQQNESIKKRMEDEKARLDYSLVKSEAGNLVKEYNNSLMICYRK